MSLLMHAAEVLVAAATVALVVGAAAFFVVRRRIRRHWHRVRDHVATRTVLSGLSMLGAWRARATDAPTRHRRGGAAGRARDMWTAIVCAEEAVDLARSLNAPIAELPAVCRNLRAVGDEIDRLLRLEPRMSMGQGVSDDIGAQVAEVIRAARDVQAAALQSCRDATEPGVRSLVREARDEVEILGAALARLRSLSSR
jgi:hypothetical protein